MDGYHPNHTAEEAVTALQNCVSIFLDQLSAERDLLLNGSAENLPEITENKQQTLNELALLENQIRPHIAWLNHDSGESDSDYSAELKQKWHRLVETLVECQNINAENGTLVGMLLNQSKNALSQLYSLCNINNAVTYNENGNQQIQTPSNRSIHV